MTITDTSGERGSLTGARLLAGLAALIGLLAVTAWLGGERPASLAGLKFNAAVGLLLVGVSLLGTTVRPIGRPLGIGFALSAAMIGLATLAQYVFAIDLGIDNLIVRDPLPATVSVVPGRMSPPTALSLLLLGAAAIAHWLRRPRAAAWLAGVALTVGALGLLAGAYGAQAPSFLAGTTDMAAVTAVGVVIASLAALLLAPKTGIVGLLLRPDLSGSVARRVMVAALTIGVVVSWLRLVGERAGLFDTAYGVTLMEIVNLLLFVGVIWWIGRSITRIEGERIGAQSEARQLDRQFRALAEAAPVGIVITDAAGLCTFANDGWEVITGQPPAEAMGTGWSGQIHPDDSTRMIEAWATALREGHDFDEVYRFRRPDGSVRWVHGRTAPLVDGTRITGHVGVISDVTEQREAVEQLNVLAAELKRSNRELEDFASAASHDLQEPLRKIQAFGDRLASRHAEQLDETGRDYLSRMVGAATRMQALITALLSFSRVASQRHELVPVSLEQVVGDVLIDLEQRIVDTEGRVEVGMLPTIVADPTQMHQLFQNIIGNALKYRREDEPPVVRVESDSASGRVQVRVADNGIGFEQSQAEKVFAPFQRLHTRTTYEGTGMGLAICRRIVERHEGTLTVLSRPGEGTTFTIDLPDGAYEYRRAA